METIYEAEGFSVIQAVYKDAGSLFIKDYEGNVYNYEDVTDDGEVFVVDLGWIMKFYLDSDIEIIRALSKQSEHE